MTCTPGIVGAREGSTASFFDLEPRLFYRSNDGNMHPVTLEWPPCKRTLLPSCRLVPCYRVARPERRFQ